MRLLLIPIYWACSIGLVVVKIPWWNETPSSVDTFTGLLILSSATVMSAETFLWWQGRAKLGVHFRRQWSIG